MANAITWRNGRAIIMYNQAALQRYQQQSVQTSSPGELTLMLYNGLVKFLKLGQMELEQKNLEKVNYYLKKSQDITEELLCTLDRKYEVTQNMALMYEYMIRRLVEANIKKDNAIIAEVLDYAEQFRDTWVQVLKLVK